MISTVSHGQNTQSPAKPAGIEERGIDVLTDTKGFDVEPYLKEITGVVRSRWIWGGPDTARPPKREQGYVVVDFRVTKDGNITDVKVHRTSQSDRLDRAAYRAISGSSPLPPFPGEFQCDFIELRFHFFYNERPADEGGLETVDSKHLLPCVTSKVTPIRR
jgi:TonB family protein